MYIIFIGDTNCGKSTIVNTIKSKEPTLQELPMTIGVNVIQYKEINNNIISIIDTGEYHINKNVIKPLLTFVNAIVIVYDITSKQSFDYAMKLYHEFKEDQNFYYLKIVGNKCDIKNIPHYKNDEVIPISGKTGENVHTFFDSFLNEIINTNNNKINNNNKKNNKNNNNCCCI